MKKLLLVLALITTIYKTTQTQNANVTNNKSEYFLQQIDSIKKVVGGVEIIRNTTGNILQIKASSIFVNTIATITNQQGKMLRQFMITGTNQKIDISNLANGTYYLKTVDGVDKFMKQ